MQRVRKAVAGILTINRSKVSNGTKLLRGVDGRSPEARRFRDLIHGYEAQFECLNEIDKALIKDAAFLVLKTENLQARHLQGEDVPSDEIVRLSGQLRRVLTALRRRSETGIPTAPTIAAHWDANHEEHDDNDEGSDA